MKKSESVSSLLILLGLALAPAAVQARNCELPHERMQNSCGGEYPNTPSESDQAVSAVQKSTRPPLILIAEYREKSRQTTNMVERAISEYKVYMSDQRRP